MRRELLILAILLFFLVTSACAINPNVTYLSDKYLYVTGNGTHLSTTFVDIAPSPHTIFTSATGAHVSTTRGQVFGTGQMNFTGWGYATLPNTNLLFTDGQASSKAFWVNLSKTQTHQIVGTRQSDITNGIGESVLVAVDSNLIVATIENSTGGFASVVATHSVPLNKPNYVVVTKSATNEFKLYINGTIEATTQMVGTPRAHPGLSYNIGGNVTTGGVLGNMMGAIDDFAVYNYAIDGTVVPSQELVVNPSSVYSASSTYGTSPLSVQFMDKSTGNAATAYSWRLTNVTGNNTELAPFSTAASTAYTLYEGNWTVNFTVTNAFGSSSSFAWVNVSEGIPPTPTPTPTPAPTASTAGSPGARFDTNKTYAIIGEQIGFYDESFGNISDWNWSFGDGQYSTLQDATHAYSSLGIYSVSLWVNTSQFNVTSNMSYTKGNLITIGNVFVTATPTAAPTIPNLPAVPPNVTVMDILYGWWWLIVVALLVLWLGRR